MSKQEKHPNTYTLKQILIFGLVTFFLFLVVMIVVEKFSNALINIFIILLPSFFELGVTFYTTRKEKRKQDKQVEQDESVEGNASLLLIVNKYVECFMKACKKTLKNSRVTKVALWLAVVVISAVWAGSINTSERFVAAIIAFVYPEEVENTLDNIKEDTPELDDDDKAWLKTQDEELVEMAEGLKISKAELDKKRVLSTSDRNEIYFLSGNHSIENWEDEEEILIIVRGFVGDVTSMKEKNIFDLPETEGGAPGSTKNEIAKISEEEPFLKDFTQKREHMEARQNAFVMYPKSSLANLVSNDEHLLALTLFYNKGDSDSIIYYYSKAIQYRFSKLKFEGLSKDHIKSELEWIAARYEDMVFTCPDSDVKDYAVKLQRAFEKLATEY